VKFVAKTIQVRVDDDLKDSVDTLYSSLGLDTSTAIRIFLAASLRTGGLPFSVTHNRNDDSVIKESITYRKSGGEFVTGKQSLTNMRAAIKAGVEHGL
jgi:DNA-damage-inducible protein J